MHISEIPSNFLKSKAKIGQFMLQYEKNFSPLLLSIKLRTIVFVYKMKLNSYEHKQQERNDISNENRIFFFATQEGNFVV
jgi:hypothetical protein